MRSSALHQAAAVTAIAAACAVGGGTVLAGAAAADPVPGQPSNMGLCSAFLAKLPAPVMQGDALGGNARSGVNQLILILGATLPDHLDKPGDLYKVRARQHPTAPAVEECTPRRAPSVVTRTVEPTPAT